MPKVRANAASEQREWRLRRASERDVGTLHALLCLSEVFRYLSDGVPPPCRQAEAWIELNLPSSAENGMGLWLLEEEAQQLAGCVGVGTDERPKTGELIYVLHPEHWGQGLATRMSWTVAERAFREGLLEQVVAGADCPNHASIAVMRRLGMRYLRPMHYPLGPGVEYVLRSDDPRPTSLSQSLLPFVHDAHA